MTTIAKKIKAAVTPKAPKKAPVQTGARIRATTGKNLMLRKAQKKGA